jgi:hypothetical protein
MKRGQSDRGQSTLDKSLLNELAMATLSLDDNFCIQYDEEIMGPVEVDFAEKNMVHTAVFPMICSQYHKDTNKTTSTPNFQALLSYSEASPFGVGRETKIDESVRKCRHIPSSQIRSVRGLNLDKIVEHVRRTLLPNESAIIAKVKSNVIVDLTHSRSY